MEVDNLNSKRKELNEETRGQIVGMSRAGSSKREISKVLGIPKSTVHNILVCFRVTHTTSSAPRSGRPKLIGEEKEQVINRIVNKKPHSTLAEIQQNFEKKTNIKASQKTIHRSLHNLEAIMVY
ncbi:16005_t:CDS:2 [Entrophospora sp. SA101]|nr:16005_t:CDS:2 [Entrophospora sp. SA101]